MKDSLKKCLDKRNTMTRSGAPAASLPTCKYFEVMRFLYEKSSNKQTESNISEDFATESLSPSSDNHASIVSEKQSSAISTSPSSSVTLSPKNQRSTTPIVNQKKKDPLKRRHSSISDNTNDDVFLQHMKEMDEKIVHAMEKESEKSDEATVFCDSIKPVLQGFNKKQLRLAKIKINQLLFDMEFSESS